MATKKLLITGAVIAVVAAGAILIPGIAAGVPLAGIAPASTVVAPDDGPGGNGQGKAWGHHKDSPDFPGNNGDNGDRHPGDAGRHDGPGNNGRGNAWGHHKDSPDFPGNGRGNPDEPEND